MNPTIWTYVGIIVAIIILLWALFEIRGRFTRRSRKKPDVETMNTWIKLDSTPIEAVQEEPQLLRRYTTMRKTNKRKRHSTICTLVPSKTATIPRAKNHSSYCSLRSSNMRVISANTSCTSSSRRDWIL